METSIDKAGFEKEDTIIIIFECEKIILIFRFLQDKSSKEGNYYFAIKNVYQNRILQ